MARHFIPCKDNTRDFRDALGCFATGVTIVTAPADRIGIGMTANSFSAVSLTPPLVLWCPAKDSERYPFFTKAQHFAIHVLREDQKDLAQAFADHGDAFDKVNIQHNAQNVPVFDDCLARFECSTFGLHDAGDHSIMVGHVDAALINEGSPLLFVQRHYGAVTPDF